MNRSMQVKTTCVSPPKPSALFESNWRSTVSKFHFLCFLLWANLIILTCLYRRAMAKERKVLNLYRTEWDRFTKPRSILKKDENKLIVFRKYGELLRGILGAQIGKSTIDRFGLLAQKYHPRWWSHSTLHRGGDHQPGSRCAGGTVYAGGGKMSFWSELH